MRPLLDAAFGTDAAHAAYAGRAHDPAGRAWLRAVALAGRGRFAAARTLTASVTAGPFVAAARCLEASMLRQSGRHAAAAPFDGAALAAAITHRGQFEYGVAAAFEVDATVGLAADALGTGRYALSARLIERAGAVPGAAEPASHPQPWWGLPRARLRREWVAAELAVYSGDTDGARAAVDVLLAADPGPARPRHQVKTQLIASAAAMASGDGRAPGLAQRAYAAATEHGLDPLGWAAAKMVGALSGDEGGATMAKAAAELETRWIRDGADLVRM